MKRFRRTSTVLVMVLLIALLPAEEGHVSATSSTIEKINQTTREKNELENQLEGINENLDNLEDTKNTLQGNLSSLNSQLTEVADNLADLERQIVDKEQEIDDTRKALEEAKATEEWQYESMVIRVRDMYERNDTSYLNAILTAGSLQDLLNAADFFEKISAYDKRKLEEFTQNRELIEEQEAYLEQEKVELDALKVAAEAEKSKVSGLISQTSNSIAANASEIAEAERRAEEAEAEIKKKEEDLEYLNQVLAEELAMSQAAANATWRDISDITFEEGDRYLLANLIYCEAGGEPYAGKLAVGSVVINRVRSEKYPNTVVGVIYQNKQFSPVASGRLALALEQNKATSDCYKAADEAMSGVTNVGNCVYFRTPVEGLTGINIGGHVFY